MNNSCDAYKKCDANELLVSTCYFGITAALANLANFIPLIKSKTSQIPKCAVRIKLTYQYNYSLSHTLEGVRIECLLLDFSSKIIRSKMIEYSVKLRYNTITTFNARPPDSSSLKHTRT